MRFRDRHADRFEVRPRSAESVGSRSVGQAIVYVFGQKFRRRIGALEFRIFVEITVVEWREHGLENVARLADIDDDAVRIERLRNETGIDHECGAMQCLGGAENRPAERMGDHNVVADFNCKQGGSPILTLGVFYNLA